MDINIKPVSNALGAEVTGINLRQTISQEVQKLIFKTWLKFHLLIFPGQILSDEDHLRVCRIFGDIQPERLNSELADPKNSAVHFVSNVRPDGILPHGDIVFHMDQMQYENPSQAMSLYGLLVPSKGGETKFSNCEKAYDSLDSNTKLQLEGLRAQNSLVTKDGQSYLGNSDNKIRKSEKQKNKTPFAIHPVIRTHPITKIKTIYVNRLLTDKIVNTPSNESEKILNNLYEIIENEEYTYEHKWKKEDLLVWDNSCLTHARNNYDSENDQRLLRRIAITGSIPY